MARPVLDSPPAVVSSVCRAIFITLSHHRPAAVGSGGVLPGAARVADSIIPFLIVLVTNVNGRSVATSRPLSRPQFRVDKANLQALRTRESYFCLPPCILNKVRKILAFSASHEANVTYS